MGSGTAQDVGTELGLAELDVVELAMEDDADSELVVVDGPAVVTVITVVSVVL